VYFYKNGVSVLNCQKEEEMGKELKELKEMNLLELLYYCGHEGIDFSLKSIGSDLYGILRRDEMRNDFVVHQVYSSEVDMADFEEELLEKFKREIESMERGNKYGL
jgi:hypothetical protein